MARMNLKKTQSSALAMKFYCRCNHHVERDKATNAGASIDECPRHSEIEAWEHVVQCRKIVSKRSEFILKLDEDLRKNQGPGATDEELRIVIGDIRNSCERT